MLFTVLNLLNDDELHFGSLAQARKVARKLPAYAIFKDGKRVEFCDPHPDDLVEPEDTPCLERPWWETER